MQAICRSFVDMICDFCVALFFPPDKTLRPASPSLLWVPWVSVPPLLDLPTYRPSVLCSAKTTVFPSQVTSLSARFPIPCLLPFSFVSLSAHGVRRTHLIPCQACCLPVCLNPVPLSKEITVLSSSQTTPLNTCPAHRSRWCLGMLASRILDYRLPSDR